MKSQPLIQKPETRSRKTFKLTLLRLSILIKVESVPGSNTLELVELTGVVSNTLRPTLTSLREEGLLRRIPEGKAYFLTVKGKRILQDIKKMLAGG